MRESKTLSNILYFADAAKVKLAAAEKSVAAQLVERVRANDAEAFDDFYKHFAPAIHGIVLARVSANDADDVVQTVFLTAYRNLHSLREPDAAGAWLAQIARNLANEFYRRARATEELAEDLSSRDCGSAQVEAREILAHIRRLPDTYKETLILRLVEGLTGPEIAARTNLTPESVRVNLHRGMKLLRERLGATKHEKR